jgi:hypothetical protein
MTHPREPVVTELSLRERMPDYLVFFGLGLVVSAVSGLIVAGVSDHSFAAGSGYTMIGLGMLLLLAGGVSGGGYANLGAGALGTMFGSELRQQEGSADDDDPEELRRQVFGRKGDPRERLRKGLRPEANPRAFWQVIAGFVYFGLGTYIVLTFAS